MKDDDEEEENTFGVVRYPCMPSLVALQQMRNRLHLAFLGRKLMKWTALATGREMRRMATELYDVYQGFGEDMRTAFILLARSRYFCPDLNSIVTENIGKRAGVIVQQSVKAVSGVKIVQFEIFETEEPPYQHLGIGKGGQTILEAKKAWLELLKRLIMMMQLRASFLMVEIANKNATKKMNVLKKIVIPRINITIGCILMELEEMARKEFHRLKKVKENKKSDSESGVLKKKKDESAKHETSCEYEASDINRGNLNIVKITEKTVKDARKQSLQLETIVKKSPDLSLMRFSDTTKLEVAEVLELHAAPYSKYLGISMQIGFSFEDKLICLKKCLNDLVVQGKDVLDTGVQSFDVSNFSEACKKTKTIIDDIFSLDDTELVDTNLEQKLELLKGHLREVIDITNEFKDQVTLSTSIEKFIRLCEAVDSKLNFYRESSEDLQNDSGVNRLQKLKKMITDVKKITAQYKEQGLLSSSAEVFLESCDKMQLQLDEYTNKNSDIENVEVSSKHSVVSAEYVENIPKELDKDTCPDFVGLSKQTNEKSLVIKKLEDFIKYFEEIKNAVKTSDQEVVLNLHSNLEEIKKLIIKLRSEGIVTASIDDFLKTCDAIRDKIEKGDIKNRSFDCVHTCVKDSSSDSSSLSEKSQISEDILMLNDVSPCKKCRKREDINEICEWSSLSEKSQISEVKSLINDIAPCNTCREPKDMNELREKSQMSEDQSLFTDFAPCNTCRDLNDIKESSNVSLCDTNTHPTETEPLSSSNILDKPTNSVVRFQDLCRLCKKPLKSSTQCQDRYDSDVVGEVSSDTDMGYVTEKKVKVIRKRNNDGSILEKKEITNIKKNLLPNETCLSDDLDIEDISDDFSDIDDKNQINMCLISENIHTGFTRSLRYSLSETNTNRNYFFIPSPNVRYCISVDNFIHITHENTFSNTSQCSSEIDIV